MTPRCFGYLRVSTERQAGEMQTSVGDQRTAIVALADRLGLVVDEWFTDAGASGATAERRPEFMRMIAAAKSASRSSRDPGYVLVLNDSRFGRFVGDDEESAYWRVAFKKLGWRVRFCEGDEMGEGVGGRAFVRLASSMQAAEYLRNLKANATRGSRGTAGQGYWVAAAPFGYRRAVVYPVDRSRVLANGVPKAKDEKVRLVPEPAEADVVRDLFERYAMPGETLGSLVAWISAAAPDRKWSVPSIRYVLGNRAYVGDVVIGRRMADADDPGKWIRRPTTERWGLDSAHEPIITRDVFEAVAGKLAANSAAPRRARSEYVLSGILMCASCGSPYVGGGCNGQPQQVYFYRCSGTLRRESICPPGGRVARHLIEPAIIDRLAAVLTRPAIRARLIESVDRALAEFANPTEGDRSLAQSEARAKERQARVAAAIADGTLTRDEAGTVLTEVRQELARIASARSHEKILSARRASVLGERDALVAKVLDGAARLRLAHGPALRAQLAYWCAAITYDRTTRRATMTIRNGLPMPIMSTSGPLPASREHTGHTTTVVVPAMSPRRRRA